MLRFVSNCEGHAAEVTVAAGRYSVVLPPFGVRWAGRDEQETFKAKNEQALQSRGQSQGEFGGRGAIGCACRSHAHFRTGANRRCNCGTSVLEPADG